MFLLVRKTAHDQIDITDFILLSVVAVVPAGFVLFPRVSTLAAQIIGVSFGFLVLFGFLLFVSFVLSYRVVSWLNRESRRNMLLMQEVSILRMKLEEHESLLRVR